MKADAFSKVCDEKYNDIEYHDCMFSCDYENTKVVLKYKANCWKRDFTWNSDTGTSSSDAIRFSVKLMGILLAAVIAVL